MVVFCFDQVCLLSFRSKIISCDGNCRSAPEPFVQNSCLLAIIQYFNIQMTCAFLNGKTEQLYGILFLMLLAKALVKFPVLRPEFCIPSGTICQKYNNWDYISIKPGQ